MCREGKFDLIYKIITFLIAAGSLLLLPFSSFAQDIPCADQDPTGTVPCPLDSWVWILLIAGMAFGAWHLYRRQKNTVCQ